MMHRKPARLCLRRRNGRPAIWVIRDYPAIELSTGCREDQVEQARLVLKSYLMGENRPIDEQTIVIPRVLPERTDRTIYFISTDDIPDYPIKIGITNPEMLETRLKGLQCACPYELKILATATGSRTNERWMHIEHWGSRIRGEWFKRTPEIMKLVERFA